MSGMVAGQIPLAASATTVTSSIPNGQLPATATNDNAAAGKVGEYITASAGSTSIAANTIVNITSISLTAGDWDVNGTVNFQGAGGAVPNIVQVGVSETSANFDTSDIGRNTLYASFSTNAVVVLPSGNRRVSIASTTTVYLVAYINFNPGSYTTTGTIQARRAR